MVDISQMKSPGVFIDEVDLSQYAAIRSQSKAFGVLGYGRKGTPNEITIVSDFKEVFGEPLASDYGALLASYLLEVVPEILYIRMANPASLEARMVTLEGTDSSEGTVTDALIVSFKEKGTICDNAIKATVTAGTSVNKFHLEIVKDDGEVLLKNTEYSMLSTDSDYIGTAENDTFLFTVNESAIILNSATNVAFSAGNDGTNITTTNFSDCCALFEDKDAIDVDIVCAPGHFLSTEIASLLSLGTKREDCVTILDHPQGATSQQVADFFNGETITVNGTQYSAPYCNSSFSAMFSPWCSVFNPTLGDNQWVPPSVAVVHAMAVEYQTWPQWTPPAGIGKIQVSLTNKTERVLTQADRDILYPNNVNPICNYKNLGWTILGQKTAQRSNSSTNRLNVRFLANYIKKVMEFSSTDYVFAEIDDTTFSSWRNDMDKILGPIKSQRGMYDYQITMNETTTTSDLANNNIMYGIVKIKATKIADYVAIDVQLLNKEDEF